MFLNIRDKDIEYIQNTYRIIHKSKVNFNWGHSHKYIASGDVFAKNWKYDQNCSVKHSVGRKRPNQKCISLMHHHSQLKKQMNKQYNDSFIYYADI